MTNATQYFIITYAIHESKSSHDERDENDEATLIRQYQAEQCIVRRQPMTEKQKPSSGVKQINRTGKMIYTTKAHIPLGLTVKRTDGTWSIQVKNPRTHKEDEIAIEDLLKAVYQ